MIEIIFLERNYNENDTERIKFQKKLKDNNIILFNNYDNKILDYKVLFYHESDESMLIGEKERGEVCVPFKDKEIANLYRIKFGGKKTIRNEENDSRLISYINYNDLQERLSQITEQIRNLKVITKEKLEEIIFAIDPKLEDYLTPFQSVMPFKECWEKSELEQNRKRKLYNERETLRSYIKQ